MKKRNKLYIVIIIILTILIIISVVLKLTLYKENDEIIPSNIINHLGNDISYLYEIDYLSKYENNIIYENITQVNYSIVNDNETLYGKAFIGDDKKLYISDDIVEKKYLLLNENIKTIYKTLDNESIYGIIIYVLTENGKVFEIHLYSTDISKREINEISLPSEVKYFTNAKVKSYYGKSQTGVVVMTNDNKMYYLPSGILYSEKVINIFDKYFIYDDRAITDHKSRPLIDKNGDSYYAGVIFIADSPVSNLEYEPSILIFTLDKKLIYMIDDDRVLEYKSKIDNVDFIDENHLVIKFENGKTIKLDGYYNLNIFD